MTLTSWITLVGIVIGAIVTLSVSRMHRKQMRQIELHRRDSTVPLAPPPHIVTAFLKRNWYFLLFGGFEITSLVRDMAKTTPVTRHVVLDIALDVAGIVFMIVLAFIIYIMRRLADAMTSSVDIMEKSSERIEAVLRIGKQTDK